MVNFDGVRHFIEFAPILCMLAAVGLATLVDGISRLPIASITLRRAIAAVFVLALLATPAVATIQTYPHGVCYFNAIAGGLRGAQARGVTDATDYWGASYWQGWAG